MYILKFQEIYKTPLWGGSKIAPFKGKTIAHDTVGESWEISAVAGDESIVINGSDAGMSLSQLVERDGERLLGKHVVERYGKEFPLLIKFIDACDNLSVQVHPDDAMARARHNSFGKTEMWYIVAAEPGAGLYSGFSQAITPEEYCRRVADNTIMNVLQFHPVKGGEVFFLPAGRVHAIGKGVFVAEIQQSSNITYRIYDYDRRDKDGNARELHTRLAQEAIDYQLYDDLLTQYTPQRNEAVQLVNCPYFTTTMLHLDAPVERGVACNDSFYIYICIEGSAELVADNGARETLHRGETCLVPAAIGSIKIVPTAEVKVLESYVGR